MIIQQNPERPNLATVDENNPLCSAQNCLRMVRWYKPPPT